MPNLVGIGNSQAPTNAMLGGLAYQDSVGEITIDKIKARTSDTATNVFVYDTRKDSDGGAWRHRTQNTSWYNEGVSQGRGARKEFPSVAVIVAYNNGLRIYDGDDPNLPMWMEAWQYQNDSSGSTNWWGGSGTGTSVAAMNGTVVLGTTTGAKVLHFISDRMSNFYTPASGNYTQPGGVANRNDPYTVWLPSDEYYAQIVNSNIEDVAMTVLPNAPTDINTGLPIPTFAVATDGGVSVIRDDRNVYDTVATTSGYVQSRKVEFSESGEYLYIIQDPSLIYSYKTSAFSVDRSGGTLTGYAGLSFFSAYVSSSGPASTTKLARGNDTTINIGHTNTGLALLYPDYSYTSNGLDNASGKLICRVTKDFNTGWMHGNIKGAFLSDTDDTDVTGTYLYLDNFSNNDKGWAFADNGSDGISGGVMTIANNPSARATDANALTGVATGTKLLVQFTVTFGAAGTLTLDDDGAGAGQGGNTNLLQATKSGSGTQTFSSIYTKTGSDRVRFIRTSGGNFQIDNFEMKILPEDDRSVNNKGLAVYGTINKNPVATGAELVAYSNFNNSRYLFQPYNSDLDFTTTMSIMFWVKDWVGSDSLLHRGPGTTRNSKTSFHLYCSYDYNYRISFTTNGSSEQSFEFNHTANLSGWQCVCFTLSGGTVRGFRNGVEQTMSSTSFSGNIFSQATDKNGLWIGTGPVGGAADTASLALLRLSASVPSAEQVKKIYNDEKCLFHENAKCTLHGTSDNVKALAFDDMNDVLHVGTSSGRSDFRGLNRINNTTTAVTTAISAFNGLVAEQ